MRTFSLLSRVGVETEIRVANRDANGIEGESESGSSVRGEGDPTVQERRNDHAKDLPEDSPFPERTSR